MALFALVSISLLLFSSSIKTTTLTQAQCLPDQRHALIQLKQGFNTTELHSWNASTDCCIWDGITCDKQTGMVTALNLTNRSISGVLNPALFNLSSLRYLNLADNNFVNTPLPQTGFERLDNLTHLDLSYSGFAGQVPISISTLTNLISIDLSTYTSNTNPLSLYDTGLKTLLKNLTKLQALRLDGVDIALNGSEWGTAVFQVGSTLQELSMADCGLRGKLPEEIFSLTNLTKLVLSGNLMLSGKLPEFTKHSFLQYLHLSDTNCTGPLPDSIGNLQYLSVLDLSNSSFYGKIPHSIGNLQYLSILNLNLCYFYGEVPSSITNLTRLETLALGSNTLTGTIPMTLFSHPSLVFLFLDDNQLSGYLPEFLNGSSILEVIELSSNNLQGQLPISIFKSPQLNAVVLNSNNFSGTFNLDIIKHNKELYSLDLSNNKLSVIEGKNHNQSFYASFPQMMNIILASCNLVRFPSFLSYQTKVDMLDLSNNKIDGVIPKWLFKTISISNLNLSHNFFTKIEGDANFSSLYRLYLLDIHSNKISGPLPLFPPGIFYVDLSSNNFFSWPAYFVSNPYYFYLLISHNILTGEIPLFICNATFLQVLDLSYNNLTGIVPPCLLEKSELKVLSLKSNKLSGPLSRNISQGCTFTTIDLSGNRINGSLPLSLMNCNSLEVLDLGNNQIMDRFPFWLGNLKNLRVLVLRSNQFYGTILNLEAKTKTNDSIFPMLKVIDLASNSFRGTIPKIVFGNLKAMETNSNSGTFKFADSNYYQNSIIIVSKGQVMEIKNSLSIFSSLDLSQNGFSGKIPEDIGQLKSLQVLNLSHNALTGPIPVEFANLEQLESLDLSSNQLSGHIPQELTSLTFLASLNLSYNNLVGEIPQANQFSTFSNASYMSNLGLCGSPLTTQCAAPHSNQGFNKSLPSMSSTDIIELSSSIGLGLGVGFASVIWSMISWEKGRKRFNFIIDRFYFRHFH
ncbi:receptor-like protein 6 [Carex rostrata]